MILEAAPLQIRAGESAAFEQAFAVAQAALTGSPGYLGHELQKCLEQADRYLLLVRWRSVADHQQGFRQSPAYAGWRQLLHRFYDPFPTVLHYTCVAGTGLAALPGPPGAGAD